jgi:hypothetical protein
MSSTANSVLSGCSLFSHFQRSCDSAVSYALESEKAGMKLQNEEIERRDFFPEVGHMHIEGLAADLDVLPDATLEFVPVALMTLALIEQSDDFEFGGGERRRLSCAEAHREIG